MKNSKELKRIGNGTLLNHAKFSAFLLKVDFEDAFYFVKLINRSYEILSREDEDGASIEDI